MVFESHVSDDRTLDVECCGRLSIGATSDPFRLQRASDRASKLPEKPPRWPWAPIIRLSIAVCSYSHVTDVVGSKKLNQVIEAEER